MINKTFFKLKSIILSGNELSLKVKKNIAALVFIKGYSVILSLLLIPITLEILGSYKYGVWITIFNMLSMIQIMDIGIGNGLKNKLTKAIVNNEIKTAKEYVSTAYIIVGIIALLFSFLFIFPWNYIVWSDIFNTSFDLNNELKNLIGITFVLTIFLYLFNLINIILISYHKSGYAGLSIAISNTIVCIIFLVFKDTLHADLFLVGLIYTLVPIVIFSILNFWLFSHHFKNIRPSFLFFKKNKVKDLTSLGGKFFIIQISILVIFQTDALIISHYLNPTEVTPYSIVYKYFSIITIFVTVILTPLWSAYTDAYENKDYSWIKNVINKQFKGFFIMIVLVFIMLFFSRDIIKLWLGEELSISLTLLVSAAVFTIINIWNIAIGTFLNGINKTKVQLLTNVIGLSINIPLSIFLIKIYGLGGVLIATSISLLFFSVFGGIEVIRILKAFD